jgi:hypothetical protein
MRTAPIGTRRWLSSRRLARRSRGLVLGGVASLPDLVACAGSERLITSEPLGVEGLAMTSLLVVDASSPLHNKDASRSLTVIGFEALVGLDHGQLSAPTTDS